MDLAGRPLSRISIAGRAGSQLVPTDAEQVRVVGALPVYGPNPSQSDLRTNGGISASVGLFQLLLR